MNDPIGVVFFIFLEEDYDTLLANRFRDMETNVYTGDGEYGRTYK
jgi:hypothetical protein